MRRSMLVTVRLTQPKRPFSMLTAILVTTGKALTMEELSAVHGRAWEDVDH